VDNPLVEDMQEVTCSMDIGGDDENDTQIIKGGKQPS
jgi:hypothetical protein